MSARPHCESWHLITVLTVCAAACASQHAKRLKKFFDPFPTLVVCLKQTRVCETVPTPLRAAADRPRAPGTVHGMDAYDRYLALEADRSTLYPPTVPSKSPRRLSQDSDIARQRTVEVIEIARPERAI